ncbi:hypothetical protein [Thiomicrospira microaerophila]|uniref:hypothetical protein n=1 Tax=Thiomicrospira microaerophila TaxID=406020 RepID=UPI0005CA75B6|nr:hypothetical protein [Thiomicrospira microaerophila]
MTSVKTNQACFEFDLAVINRDFKFICLERDQGNWFGSPTLDQALQDTPAKAVHYGYGKLLFLMFDATQDVEKIKHQLQAHDTLSKVKIQSVNAIEQPQGEVDPATRPGIFGKWLAQILINSLVAARASDQAPISNLGGKFYWLVSKDKFKALALKVEINFQGMLTLQATHFSAQSAGWVDKSKPQYTIESSNSFKRVFVEEIKAKKPITYIAKAFTIKGQTTKAGLPFLTINKLSGFNKSKLGIWHQLHQRIEKRLNPYLRLSFDELNLIERRKLDKATTLTKRAKLLGCKRIVLVDEVHADQSQAALDDIQTTLSAQPGLVVTQAAQTQPNALNIRLVNSADYYADNKIADPYQSAHSQHAIQHLILSTWQEAETNKARKPILQVCLKEAQLKQEVLQQQLVSFDWSRFCKTHHIQQPVSFLKLVYPSQQERGTKKILEEHISLNAIQIQPNGQLSQSRIDDQIMALTSENRLHQAWLELARAERCKQRPKEHWLGDLIGLMVIGEQILGFYQSEMLVMPNYTQIGQVLKQTEQPLPEHWQTPQDWLKQLETFKQQPSGLVNDLEHSERLDKFATLLNQCESDVIFNRKQINRLIGEGLTKNTLVYIAFNDYLEQQGIVLRFSKAQASLDVHTPGLVELNIYQQGAALGYSVGMPRGALQQTFERGSPIRWIKSLNDQPIEIEKTSALLADLLDVDFIQAKQSGTVWPFVFSLID